MKVKQPRRWKKHTVQEQGEISNRFSGRILWAMLLLGGIGTLVALGISGGSGTPQNSSRTISDSAFQKVDEKLTAAFPARNLFLRTLTNGIAATGGNRIGDVYFTEERLLECPKQLDAAALSDTADAISQFYAAYQIPTAVIAVPPAGEFYADDLLDEMSYPSQRTAIDSFYQEISSPVRKIDVYHVLFTATNDYIYYRTDAKWSSYGAYCVYRNAIQRMGFAPISYDQYTVTHVASFRGNLYDACLYSKVTPDILDVYQNENGSQITEIQPYLDSVHRLLDTMSALRDKGLALHHLDMGGGLGIQYRPEDQPPTPQTLLRPVRRMMEERGFGDAVLIVEPGRSIVGDAGLMLTQVEYIKQSETRNFCIVDGAMTDLIRPALYSAWMDIVPVVERHDAAPLVMDVVGPVCESSDFLGRARELAVREGDWIAVCDAGAYGASMASRYNSRMLPMEVMIDGERVLPLRTPDTFDEMVSGEVLLEL